LAEEQYKDEPGRALPRVESTMARLSRKRGVSHVVGGLRHMEPRNNDVREVIRKIINYLENNINTDFHSDLSTLLWLSDYYPRHLS